MCIANISNFISFWPLCFMVRPVKTRIFLITATKLLMIYSVLIETGDCDIIPDSKFVMQTTTKFNKKRFNTGNKTSVD